MAGSRMESSRIAFFRDLIVCVCTVISGLSLPVSLAASDPGDAKPVKFQQLEELESSECVRLKSMSVWCETAGTGEAGPMASFPNLMEQSNEDQAYESLKKYLPLLELDPHDGPTSPPSCPLYLRKYICPLFAPECFPGVDVPQLPPCRHVCHAAAGACSDPMRRVLSMDWPSQWTCDTLPVDGLCLNISLSTSRVTPKPEVRSHVMLWPSSGGSLMPPPSSTSDRARKLDREMFRSESRSQQISSSIFADGDRRFFRGWVDVQGRGSANDYCRVIGTNKYNRFLSCALDGAINAHAHTYVSKRGFSIGQWKTWYMRDMDGDGRDDYCRCIIIGLNVSEVCMKAGPRGFYGSRLQSGSEFSFNVLKPASNSLCRTLNQHPVRSNQHPVRFNRHPARSNPHPVQLNQHPVRPNQHPVQNNQHLQRLRH